MYWLLNEDEKNHVRRIISKLTVRLSLVLGNPQEDQIFPFVGRKDRRKAAKVVESLSPHQGVVLEPFAGSGSIVYAIAQEGRELRANEWEPYAWRMANAPWRLPSNDEYRTIVDDVSNALDSISRRLYKAICVCGNEHVLDSLFFDRVPLSYTNITEHERLGPTGENVTYRGKYKCPNCGATQRHLLPSDLQLIDELSGIPAEPIFDERLIENSRININGEFVIYGNLFPHRSKLALAKLWEVIHTVDCSQEMLMFLEDAFLSILPQAKYKDYRSKSQDLHCPEIQLREVNIFNRFNDQLQNRYARLKQYNFSREWNPDLGLPIQCMDYRAFFLELSDSSVDLVFTDPPWLDGNAYFEKAQLYHPWLDYKLSEDCDRLDREIVITDAPSRRHLHDLSRWWEDIKEFFFHSKRVTKTNGYLALFFRPVPPNEWLVNINRLKLIARQNGFEPLLSIDVGSSDPSMRIQQSAAYVWSRDIVLIFLKLDRSITRYFVDDIDIDQMVFQEAEHLQESLCGPFSFRQWRDSIARKFNEAGVYTLNDPGNEQLLLELFNRYCDLVSPGQYLPKLNTPFSGQLFDTPAVERLFTYVPSIINELTANNDIFSYDQFLLSLSTYVENGTRSLIRQIEELDVRDIISPYAEPLEEGRYFRKRSMPVLTTPIQNVFEMDPYEFERFVGHLMIAQGYSNVAVIGRAGDRGVDLVADDPDNKKTVIQCKRYLMHNVSATPIQRLHSFAVTRGAERKIIITTSDFTPQAIQEAGITQTETINGDQLSELIARFIPEHAC